MNDNNRGVIPSPNRGESIPDFCQDCCKELQPPTCWIEYVRPHWSLREYDRQARYRRGQIQPAQFLANQIPNREPAFYGEICQNYYPIYQQQCLVDQTNIHNYWHRIGANFTRTINRILVNIIDNVVRRVLL